MRKKDSYHFPFAAYPAVRIMLLLMIGLCISNGLSSSLLLSISLFAFSTSAWFLFEYVLRRKWVILSSHGAIFFYALLIISASMSLASLQENRFNKEMEGSDILQLYEWEELTVRGTIIDSGTSSSGRNVYGVEVTETDVDEDNTWDQIYRLRLYTVAESDQKLSIGDHADLQVRIYEFPEYRNPIGFDYGNWLNRQGFIAHGDIQKIIKVKKGSRFGFGHLRDFILRNIDQLFEPKIASLAKALLLGYKDDLTQETRQHFSRAGLSHIMAVSGLHVGFVVAPLWIIIPFLWGSQKGKWLGLAGLTFTLFLYAGLTGFSPSVNRASLMAWFLTVGRLFHKPRNSINLTAVAAIILLLINPRQLFDTGFQLSFSAVFIILLVMPEVQRSIPKRYQFGWIGSLVSIVSVSIVVQLGLFPILAHYFGEFSIIGPLSNALVVPILTVMVPIGLLLVLLYSLFPALIQVVAMPIELLLKWIQNVATYTGGSQGSFIQIEEISASIFLIWFAAVFLTASLRIPNIRWKWGVALLLIINVFLIEQVLKDFQPKTMKITFLDVGQGDAIHIKTPNNKHLLVDAGRWSPQRNSGEDVILPYLKEHGIDKLDGVLLTHPHADHIGGMEEIIQNIKIDTIYQTDAQYESELFSSYMDNARQKGIPIKNTVEGEMIQIDPSIRIFMIGPDERSVSSNVNNNSLSFKMVYGNRSVLFTGDAEEEQEFRFASRYEDFLKSDLYKVGHHASNSSSTAPFMRFVQPAISVASLALENRYDHPGEQAVTRLHSYSEEQMYTSLTGAVMYVTDGNSFQRMRWKDR